jgi:SAM-dependent methyltransferase
MNHPGHTPLAVAELIKDIIQDKVVCDIGCGQGELMTEFAKYAKQVIGIENDGELASFVREKGFQVIGEDSFYNELPPADVYYAWTRDAMGVYLKAKDEGTKGVFIFGDSIRPSLNRFLTKLNPEIREVEGFKIFITTL